MAAANGRHGLQNCVVGRALLHQQFARGIFFGGRNRQQDMFSRNVFVFQALRFIERAFQNFGGGGTKLGLRAAGNFGQTRYLFFRFARNQRRRHSELLQQRRDHAVALRHQCPQDVQRLDLLLARALTHLLGGLERFLGLDGEFVGTNHERDNLTFCWRGKDSERPAIPRISTSP
jgi:hypothetical protein